LHEALKMCICFALILIFHTLHSNGSGSREATTIRPYIRGRGGDTSATGQGERVPVPPTMNDKYIDLMAILLGHVSDKTPANYDKVIIMEQNDDLNPSMSEMLEVKLG
jgi:hypothetical protein